MKNPSRAHYKRRQRGDLVTDAQLPWAAKWEEIRYHYCRSIGWNELADDASESLRVYNARMVAQSEDS